MVLDNILQQVIYTSEFLNCCVSFECPECNEEDCEDCSCVNIQDYGSSIFTVSDAILTPTLTDIFQAVIQIDCNGNIETITSNTFSNSATLEGFIQNLINSFTPSGVTLGAVSGSIQKFRIFIPNNLFTPCDCSEIDNVTIIINNVTLAEIASIYEGVLDCCNTYQCPSIPCEEGDCFNPTSYYSIPDLFINLNSLYTYRTDPLRIIFTWKCNNITLFTNVNNITGVGVGSTLAQLKAAVNQALDEYQIKELNSNYYRAFINYAQLQSIVGECDCENISVNVSVQRQSLPLPFPNGTWTTLQGDVEYKLDCCVNDYTYNPCNNCLECGKNCQQSCSNLKGYKSGYLTPVIPPALLIPGTKYQIRTGCSGDIPGVYYTGIAVSGVNFGNFTAKVKESLAGMLGYVTELPGNTLRIGVPDSQFSTCPNSCEGGKIELWYETVLPSSSGPFGPISSPVMVRLASTIIDCCEGQCPDLVVQDCECIINADFKVTKSSAIATPHGVYFNYPFIETKIVVGSDTYFNVRGVLMQFSCCEECVNVKLNSIYSYNDNLLIAANNTVNFVYADASYVDQLNSNFLTKCDPGTIYLDNFAIKLIPSEFSATFFLGGIILTFEVDICGIIKTFSFYY